MKISYNWLKDYISTDLDPEEIADILTNTGLEVENLEKFESVKGGLEGCVVGKVIKCEKHPNADKLSITSVDIGEGELLPIVCGAPNVRSGQKVVVAKTGTTLYKGQESITLRKVKIRGEVSEGMICAEDELGLGDSHQGIMVLDEDTEPGMAARDYFDIYTDTVFEIGLTPNRIDGASHYGAARDLAAYLNLYGSAELVKPSVESFSIDNKDRQIEVIIENKDACKRYSGITISGVRVEDSPLWLKNRLLSVGLSPINNIVDISNYVLYELGQPLHAFDADRITGEKVIVRCMKKGTRFVTLDQQERSLSEEDLMICNTEEGMCIAGVFGGISSGVSQQTRNIFLESAWFDPGYVRKTSKRHGLPTDASFRFERGTDPEMTVYALKRAAAMIRDLAGGTISSEIVDVCPEAPIKAVARVRYKNIDRLIGKKIDKTVIHKILGLLDIESVNAGKEEFEAIIPTYRVDVTREADVIEEILRIYGYNNIGIGHKMLSSISHFEKPDKEKLTSLISNYLTDNGFSEIVCNSLSKEAYYEGKNDIIRLSNPISSDLSVMRTTMVFGGLETISYNSNRQRPNLKLYEFGNCYTLQKDEAVHKPEKAGESIGSSEALLKSFREQEFFALFISGNKSQENWLEKTSQASFFQLKSYTDNILKRLSICPDELDTRPHESEYLSEGISYYHQNLKITEIGILKKELLSKFDVKVDVFYSEINWTGLLGKLDVHGITFRELPKFPEVKRDLSMILDKKIRYEEIRKLAFATEREKLISMSLFDVYEGKNISPDKKSYAVSFVLQDESRTLTDKQIDTIMNQLATTFEKKLGARIRK